MTSPLTTGTVSVTNGQAGISGLGTNWLVAGIRAGDLIFIVADDGSVFANTIAADAASNTALTLVHPYPGMSDSGLSYAIVRFFGSDLAADTYRKVNELVAQLETNAGLLGISVDAIVADLASRSAYDAEDPGFVVLVVDADGNGRSAIFIMEEGSPPDWSSPAYLTGEQGPAGLGDYYTIVIWIQGKPRDEEIVLRHEFEATVTFPTGLTGSRASAITASDDESVFVLEKNGTPFGSITFNESDTGSFAAAMETEFTAGDILTVLAPTPRDATLEDISITLLGNR